MVHKLRVQAGAAGSAGPGLDLEVEPLGDDRYRLVTDGQEEIVHARRVSQSATGVTTWSLVPDGGGPQRQVDVEGALPDLRLGMPSGDVLAVKLEDARAAALAAEVRRPAAAGPQQLRAPMPGKVVKLLCKPGDTVQAGQGLLLIEAMKMENELRAPAACVIKEICVVEGQSVEGGAVLVILAGGAS